MKSLCSSLAIAFIGWSVGAGWLLAEDADLPLVAQDDFEQGVMRWQPLDTDGWKAKKTDRGIVLSQFKKESSYQGPQITLTHA